MPSAEMKATSFFAKNNFKNQSIPRTSGKQFTGNLVKKASRRLRFPIDRSPWGFYSPIQKRLEKGLSSVPRYNLLIGNIMFVYQWPWSGTLVNPNSYLPSLPMQILLPQGGFPSNIDGWIGFLPNRHSSQEVNGATNLTETHSN